MRKAVLSRAINTIMKATKYHMIAMAALLGSAPVYAASLGDAIKAAEAAPKTVEAAVAKGALGSVECVISEAALCSELWLPDAFRSGRTIKPEQEGQLILFITGSFTNKGEKSATPEIPAFLSAEGKKYKGKSLYFHGVKCKEPFISLNPDEKYRFSAYFMLPTSAIIGGKLLLKESNPFSSTQVEIDLPFDAESTVHDKLTKKGITNNSFDARDSN